MMMEGADRGLQPAVEDGAFEIMRSRYLQAQIHVRCQSLESLDGLDQPAVRIGAGAVHDADMKLAPHGTPQAADLGAEIRQPRKEALSRFVNDVSFVGEAKANPPTLAEPHSQASFEVGDQRADPRLAEIEA